LQVFYTKDEEHLPYILASGVWHYYEMTQYVVNGKRDQNLVAKFLKIQQNINECINPAIKNPIIGEKFSIVCNTKTTYNLLVDILHHYLNETKGILRTIEDPIITQKCLEDVDIIENRLITAITVETKEGA